MTRMFGSLIFLSLGPLSDKEWYSEIILAQFDKKEDAVGYMRMICADYNQSIKGNKDVKKEDNLKCPECGSSNIEPYEGGEPSHLSFFFCEDCHHIWSVNQK